MARAGGGGGGGVGWGEEGGGDRGSLQAEDLYSHEKHDGHQNAPALAEQEERRCWRHQTLISLCDCNWQIQGQS